MGLALVVSIALFFILLILLVTPFEAVLLNQDLDYMYYLNMAETGVFVVGLLSGISIAFIFIFKNYTVEKIKNKI